MIVKFLKYLTIKEWLKEKLTLKWILMKKAINVGNVKAQGYITVLPIWNVSSYSCNLITENLNMNYLFMTVHIITLISLTKITISHMYNYKITLDYFKVILTYAHFFIFYKMWSDWYIPHKFWANNCYNISPVYLTSRYCRGTTIV